MSADSELHADVLRRQYAANVDNRLQAAGLGALALAAAVYPLVLEWLAHLMGPRVVAAVLALACCAAAMAATTTASRLTRATTAALAAGAAITASVTPLLLVAAGVHATLAYLFLISLREQRSLIERVAKTIQPAAPDFIGPYCRGVTALWGTVFIINATVLAALALLAPIEVWRAVAGAGVWAWMGVLTVAEFLVRKTYFRNYWYRGPFERVWSRLFPAEATAMGRRSQAHIREVREKLGLDD
ncbi:MAG TPA: hypothetical protein VEC57_15235 [Candidatus Limnocylindrales bacterium]|nr:hypothetical protein [Candidatus Limnocylindrales bacterium]